VSKSSPAAEKRTLFALTIIVLPHVMTQVVVAVIHADRDDVVNLAAAGGITTAVCVITRMPQPPQPQQRASSPAASCLNTTLQSEQFRPLTRG